MRFKLLISLLLTGCLLAQCSKDKDNKQEAPDPSLLANYTLNDELKDASGKVEFTLYSGIIKAVPDRNNIAKGAMYFESGKMWANVPNWPADSLSITCWVKSNNPSLGSYFVLSAAGAFGLYEKNSTLGMAISTPITNSALASFDVTTWTHLACTYDGIDIKTYINGKIKTTKNHPGKPDLTWKFEVGSFNGWSGALDDLRFYKRVLNADEIASLAAN